MNLTEQLRAIRNADPDEDLAVLLAVEPSEIRIGRNGVTIAGETISIEEARAALAADHCGAPSTYNYASARLADARTVKIEDL